MVKRKSCIAVLLAMVVFICSPAAVCSDFNPNQPNQQQEEAVNKTPEPAQQKQSGKLSDLRVDQIFLDRECRINLKVRNAGKYKMPDSEHLRGMVRVYFGDSHEDFFLRQGSLKMSGGLVSGQAAKIPGGALSRKIAMDPRGALKNPGSSLSYNTNIVLKERVRVKAYPVYFNRIASADKTKGRSHTLNPTCRPVSAKPALKKEEMNLCYQMDQNKLVLNLDDTAERVEVYAGKVKIGETGGGKNLDVTEYFSRAKGDELHFVSHGESGVKKSGYFDIAKFKEPVTSYRIRKGTSKLTDKRRRDLISRAGTISTSILPLITGTHTGGAAQENRYIFNCLRVDGSSRAAEVGDTLTVSTDFNLVPLGVSVQDDVLYLTIRNSDGEQVYETILRGTPLSGWEINLADVTGSTSGEYTMRGMVMTDLGSADFTWWGTNSVTLYYGVDMPDISLEPIETRPFFIPPDTIPADGWYDFHARTNKNVVDPNEEFTISWDEWEHPSVSSYQYRVSSQNSSRMPEGASSRYWDFDRDTERRFTTRAVDAFLSARLGSDPRFFSEGWLYLEYLVYARSLSGDRRSNTIIVHVRPPGNIQPAPPLLGIEQCGAIGDPGDVPKPECGDGVHLFWSHSPEEEGGFIIETKSCGENDRHWRTYRAGIPSAQRSLFIPVSEFADNCMSFRMYFSRLALSGTSEEIPDLGGDIGEIEVIDEVGSGLLGTISSDSRSVYSNSVGIHTILPPVMLRVWEEPRVCGHPLTFEWTAMDGATRYTYEVSSDPTFQDGERLVRGENYVGPGAFIPECPFCDPEACGGVRPGDFDEFNGAQVLYIRVKQWRTLQHSNWSNVLFYRFSDPIE